MMMIKQTLAAASLFLLALAQQGVAQERESGCDDIDWKSAVTDQYPSIANACDAVVTKNGKLYARVEVELLRVSNRTLTFRIQNNDGTSGGTYTQTVDTNWRAHIGGENYRPRDLSRGQKLNVYMPGDRWVVIPEMEDETPAVTMAVVPKAAPMLPQTASSLPLFGVLGGMLIALAAGLGWVRRRFN
jgi:LPXTG-motif cell wall-anchored protein